MMQLDLFDPGAWYVPRPIVPRKPKAPRKVRKSPRIREGTALYRVRAALRERPHTLPELIERLGIIPRTAAGSIQQLRWLGYEVKRLGRRGFNPSYQIISEPPEAIVVEAAVNLRRREILETNLPTVQDMFDHTWTPPAWPKGYACIYKATNKVTGGPYIGKAVDLMQRFQCGHMKGEEYFGNSLGVHGPENFYIEILWIGFTEADAYGHEDLFIEEHRSHRKHGGYNIHTGGEGWTQEEARAASALVPAGQRAIGSETNARMAGFPFIRTMKVLEEATEALTYEEIALAAGAPPLTSEQISKAISVRAYKQGVPISREEGYRSHPGKFRLHDTMEDAAMVWDGGDRAPIEERIKGMLLHGRYTAEEMAPFAQIAPKDVLWQATAGTMACLSKANIEKLRVLDAQGKSGSVRNLQSDASKKDCVHVPRGTEIAVDAWDSDSGIAKVFVRRVGRRRYMVAKDIGRIDARLRFRTSP